MTLDEAVIQFLLALKVEGRASATLSCYRRKLMGWLWYAGYADWPNDITQVTTTRIREFLVYLRDTDSRFGGRSERSRRPCNNTTRRNYFRVLSSFFKWLLSEELVSEDPTSRIRTPKAEKKVIHALTAVQVNQLLAAIDTSTFTGIRNRAIILVLVDCGLRLGELIGLTLRDVGLDGQTLSVNGKSGERVVGFGSMTLEALAAYMAARTAVHPYCRELWVVERSGTALKASAVSTAFKKLAKATGIAVRPHRLRHTFATLWLRNGGDALHLQRLLGHSTLAMTNKYCQAFGMADARRFHALFGPGDRLAKEIEAYAPEEMNAQAGTEPALQEPKRLLKSKTVTPLPRPASPRQRWRAG